MRPACVIAVARAAGREITQEEANGLEARLRQNLRNLAQLDREKFLALSTDQRLMAAAQMTADELKYDAARKKHQVLLTAQALSVLDKHIDAMARKGFDGLKAVYRTLVFKSDSKSNFMSAETKREAIAARAMGQLWEFFEATDSRLFGFISSPEGVRALTMELYGEDSGSALAKQGAAQFKKVTDGLREHFNALGGDIAKLEDWNIPQHHDQMRVYSAGRDKWVSDTLPLLNREKYVNEYGRLRNDSEMRAFLDEAFLTISSGGMNKIEVGVRQGTGAMSNRGNQSRQIHFKDADSYLRYQTEYGGSTLASVAQKHISSISRDIALVDTYGPNPDQMFLMLTQREAKKIALSGQKTGDVDGRIKKLDDLFNYIGGRRDPIASEWLARFGDNLRQWLIASRLGSSSVAAIPDQGTLHMTAFVNNVSHMQIIRNQIAALNPLDPMEKRIALRNGLGTEAMIAEINRWGDDNLGNSFSSKLAATNMRLSGLEALDAANRRSFGAAFYDYVGAVTREHETLASIPKEDAGLLQKKGVTETDWAVWRAAETEDWGNGNSRVIGPEAIMRIPDEKLAALRNENGESFGDVFLRDPTMTAAKMRTDAMLKLLGIVLEEGKMVVPSPGAAERVFAGGGLQRGTLSGELWRTVMLFKSFPLAMITKHFMRGWGMETAGGKAVYIASLVASTTILGALVVQVNNLISGKDPQKLAGTNAKPWEIQKNWVAAFLKGGSMGLYGDFLFSSVSKNGNNDMFGALAGPGLGLVQEAMNLTQGNAIQWMEGKETHFGSEFAKTLKGVTPFASLWYAKAALDHLVFQQLAEYLSPGYLYRMQNSAQQQFNEKFWWKPGTGVGGMQPPNLGRVVGQQ